MAALWLTALVPAAAATLDHLDAEGYRDGHYRAPTPLQAPAGTTLDTEGLRHLLQQEEPLLIDVHPILERAEGREFGDPWLITAPRYHLPGSVWLPNVGYARPKPHQLRYLAENLRRLTGGDPGRPLVIYCNADCWMSWNAVLRIERLGYRRLYWYRDGVQGWERAGGRLERGDPEPLP